MKIVIEIPDSLIKKVKDHYVNPYDVDEICDAILDGKPLSKGHGRLIDADALFNNNFPKADIQDDEFRNWSKYPCWTTDITGLQTILKNAPTIIDAD